jgi:hypothetical protein
MTTLVASALVDAVAVWGLQTFDAACCVRSIAACSGYGPRARRVEYAAGAARTPRFGEPDFGVRCEAIPDAVEERCPAVNPFGRGRAHARRCIREHGHAGEHEMGAAR